MHRLPSPPAGSRAILGAVAPLALAASTWLAAPVLVGAVLAAPVLAAAVPVAVLSRPALAAPANDTREAQEGARPDQVYVRSKRDGSVGTVNGAIQRYELGKVVIAVSGKGEQTIDSALVQRVTWGDVPPSYREGQAYYERSSFEDATKSFRVAAGDAAARDLVKAAARLMAIESLLRWGAADPVRFTEAASEAGTYLSAYATNRDVPRVRMLQARATWLAGKPAEAGAIYKSIHSELKGETTTDGYDVLTCLRAGLDGARALLEAKDTLGGRELYTALEAQVGPLVAGGVEGDPQMPVLRAILDEATLGSGYVDLAGNQSKQALTFFQNKANALAADSSQSLRFGVWLGLGEAMLRENRAREASLLFAKVAALESADRDRAARATIRLAEAFHKLGDGDARPQACARVKDVLARFGDTPASNPARELQKQLGC
jgi:hypothetical protein